MSTEKERETHVYMAKLSEQAERYEGSTPIRISFISAVPCISDFPPSDFALPRVFDFLIFSCSATLNVWFVALIAFFSLISLQNGIHFNFFEVLMHLSRISIRIYCVRLDFDVPFLCVSAVDLMKTFRDLIGKSAELIAYVDCGSLI